MIARPRRGRPPVPGSGVPHLLRASVSRRDVVHVTWETLDALRGLIMSPSTGARRAAVAAHAAAVGQDFELSMGHHLGVIDATAEGAST